MKQNHSWNLGDGDGPVCGGVSGSLRLGFAVAFDNVQTLLAEYVDYPFVRCQKALLLRLRKISPPFEVKVSYAARNVIVVCGGR